MHFLFIASYLGNTAGGTETLVARMSNWLLNKGHSVTLLTTTVREYRDLLPKAIGIRELGDQMLQLYFCRNAKKAWAALQMEMPDVIKAFDLPAAWIASIFSSVTKPPAKVVFGDYYPYIVPKNRIPSIYKLFLLNVRLNFPDESILCMSTEQIRQFQRNYGSHRNPKFWPLPVEDPSKNVPARTPKWGLIVSIGRLSPMKEYNLYMIEVVARLRQKGFPVRWNVFGDGEMADAMQTRIAALGLGEAIEMKGWLAYSRLAAALQDAYVFVGMGTAMIEACLCGVPGVVALAHDTSGVTYGPLYRFTFGNAGERMDKPPATTVEAEIERILNLSKPEYDQEVQMSRDYARRYEMDSTMEQFLEFAFKASPAKGLYALFYCYYIANLAKKLLQKLMALSGSMAKRRLTRVARRT